MIISSLLVETAPGCSSDVEKELSRVPQVEVHGVEKNQVIVTIEAETVDESHDVASGFIKIPDVRNVNLVYLNFEDDAFIKKAVGKL